MDRLDAFTHALADEAGAARLGQWVLFRPLPHEPEVRGRLHLATADGLEGRQQHRTVAVVAAGMHFTWCLGGGQGPVLPEWECVDVPLNETP